MIIGWGGRLLIGVLRSIRGGIRIGLTLGCDRRNSQLSSGGYARVISTICGLISSRCLNSSYCSSIYEINTLYTCDLRFETDTWRILTGLTSIKIGMLPILEIRRWSNTSSTLRSGRSDCVSTRSGLLVKRFRRIVRYTDTLSWKQTRRSNITGENERWWKTVVVLA